MNGRGGDGNHIQGVVRLPDADVGGVLLLNTKEGIHENNDWRRSGFLGLWVP